MAPVNYMQDGYQYRAYIKGNDNAGNIEDDKAGNIFTFDISSPTAIVTVPESGKHYKSLAGISGTANDAGQLTKVEIAVKEYDSGMWYSLAGRAHLTRQV